MSAIEQMEVEERGGRLKTAAKSHTKFHSHPRSNSTGEQTETQLKSVAANLRIPRFAGVFASNELPKNPTGKCFIANYDPRSKGGSHWVAFDFRRATPYYFDSYGLAPDEADRILRDSTGFRQYLVAHSTSADYDHNTNIFQCLTGDECGIYALYFLLHGPPDVSAPAWREIMQMKACTARDNMMERWWMRNLSTV